MKTATILIVEDEKALNEAYQVILQKEGFNVFAAYDGKEALQIVNKIEPDVILLDLRMPRISGIDFLKLYKPQEHTHVKIIVFSNLDTQKEIDDAFELGADRYMLKALASPKELVRLVNQTLSDEKIQLS